MQNQQQTSNEVKVLHQMHRHLKKEPNYKNNDLLHRLEAPSKISQAKNHFIHRQRDQKINNMCTLRKQLDFWRLQMSQIDTVIESHNQFYLILFESNTNIKAQLEVIPSQEINRCNSFLPLDSPVVRRKTFWVDDDSRKTVEQEMPSMQREE